MIFDVSQEDCCLMLGEVMSYNRNKLSSLILYHVIPPVYVAGNKARLPGHD